MGIIRRNRPAAPPVVGPSVASGPQPGVHDAVVNLPVAMPPVDATPQTRAITAIANQANACLGLVGITGSGKTSLGVTAVEEAWEVYQSITRWYASDLGGFGNKLLALIRLGICQVWYIRNHHNPFTTMELASQGYWPEHMQDLETGLAAPDVRLVPPRQVKFVVVCPNGHNVAAFTDPAQVAAMQLACPTCGQITTAGNALRVDRVVVRSAGFKHVGHYVYDSMSQMSEWGQIDLRGKSARGELPTGGSGGSALGSADAVREVGGAVFGTGSKAQVGFMQDRVPVWLGNIRALPDQVLPPIVTFGVERSKGDDESGGIPIFGPKIAGNARTSQVPGWLGNCLYVAKEPHNPPETDESGNIVLHHRLWLVNHIDPRDTSSTPIVAKHRGEPLGMPDYLEDSGKPEEAWTRCSLRVFYKLLREQAVLIEQRARAQFPNAPALVEAAEDGDEIVETAVVGQASSPTSMPTSTRVRRRRTVTVTEPAAAPTEASTPIEEPATVATTPSEPAASEPSPLVTQLEDSLALAHTTAPAGNGAATSVVVAPAGVTVIPPAAVTPEPASSVAPPRTSTVNRIRRVPRPPAE